MRLFDASSIVEVLITRKEDSVDILRTGFQLELTLYEVGNSIRRVYSRRKQAEQTEVMRKIRAAAKILGLMDVTPIVTEEAEAIMGIAIGHSLTFYDAAYMYAARRDGLVLVTEDEALRKVATDMGCPTEKVANMVTV
jgi:predicted nucleic acid-binding protein